MWGVDFHHINIPFTEQKLTNYSKRNNHLNVVYIRCTLGVFHNRNLSNLDSSDQRIRLFCDLNLNLDYESIDLPLEVDQQIQCPRITHNSL